MKKTKQRKKLKLKKENLNPLEKIKAWELIFKYQFGWSTFKLHSRLLGFREKFKGKYHPKITGHLRSGYHAEILEWFYKKVKRRLKNE